MSTRNNVPPIERDTITYVLIRVSVRLIARDYRRNPTPYQDYPAAGVLALAGRMRMLYPMLWGPLVFVAKCLSQGYSTVDIRTMDVAYQARALHKRRPTSTNELPPY